MEIYKDKISRKYTIPIAIITLQIMRYKKLLLATLKSAAIHLVTKHGTIKPFQGYTFQHTLDNVPKMHL